jgi:hypothetical protein
MFSIQAAYSKNGIQVLCESGCLKTISDHQGKTNYPGKLASNINDIYYF